MSKNGDEYTADVRGVIDDTAFEFNATGNGSRIVVSTGMRKLFHNKYWNPIQDKCPDVLPGDRNRESVPTMWFMATTANPPASTKAKHRRILRMVHMICSDARAEGANFRSDKVFSRTTPVLQVERNVLESADYWEHIPELSANKPKKHRRVEEDEKDTQCSEHGDEEDGEYIEGPPVAKRQRHQLLLFGPEVTDLMVIDDTITAATTIAEREHFGLPILRGLFYESTSVMDFIKGLVGLRKLELEVKHMELDQNSKRASGEADANSKRIQEEENAKYKRAIGDADAKSKRAQEEKDAILKHERDATELAARILREDADAAAKREIAQDRERVDIDHVAKKLEMERKASYKQSDRMRRPGKRLLLTDQRAQIVEMWEDKYAFSHGAGDEMVVCTAHADCRDFHCMSMYDALAFDTELGEATEDRRVTMAPACAKGLLLMGVTGAVVLTRPTGKRNELLHYYSRQSAGNEGLLRTRLPCNVTGIEKLVCTLEWDHIESVARGGVDESSNLHLISAVLNATIGDANTREWAVENGYGPLKVEPPSTSTLAASLMLPSWNGRDATSETAIRLARARIEILVPWDGVSICIKRKAKKTGQTVLNFPRAEPADDRKEADVQEETGTQKEVDVKEETGAQKALVCHRKQCKVVVLDTARNPLPGVGTNAGKNFYCALHAAQHLVKLKRAKQYRVTSKQKKKN
jgi:hypothetical protein